MTTTNPCTTNKCMPCGHCRSSAPINCCDQNTCMNNYCVIQLPDHVNTILLSVVLPIVLRWQLPSWYNFWIAIIVCVWCRMYYNPCIFNFPPTGICCGTCTPQPCQFASCWLRMFLSKSLHYWRMWSLYRCLCFLSDSLVNDPCYTK